MEGQWRFFATAALILILLLPAGSAQEAAEYTIQGATYHISAGSADSGHATAGLNYTGGGQLPFTGCGYSLLRDEKDLGRIQVLSQLGDATLTVDMNEFEGEMADMSGGIARDVYIDGSRSHAGIQHPTVFASAAAWGTAEAIMDGQAFLDPVTGQERLVASWYITPQGFRDDETGRVVAVDGSQYEPGKQAKLGELDWEMHMRLESPEGAKLPATSTTFTQPRGDPGYFMPSEAYSDLFIFANERYGGTGTLSLESTALAQPGDNNFTFTLRRPDGGVLERASLLPALNDPSTFSASFPLDTLGLYSLEVEGYVSLSEYTVTFEQQTADKFDLDMWWDNVTFGQDGTPTLTDCQEAILGGDAPMTATIPPPPPPPQFQWAAIVLGILGVVTAILTGIKLTSMVLVSLSVRSDLSE